MRCGGIFEGVRREAEATANPEAQRKTERTQRRAIANRGAHCAFHPPGLIGGSVVVLPGKLQHRAPPPGLLSSLRSLLVSLRLCVGCCCWLLLLSLASWLPAYLILPASIPSNR